MKASLIEERKKIEKIDYPCLRKAICGSIYLFFKNRDAVIVYPRGSHTLGQCSLTIEIQNTDPFDGQVILQND